MPKDFAEWRWISGKTEMLSILVAEAVKDFVAAFETLVEFRYKSIAYLN